MRGYNTRWALAALSAMPVAIAVAIAPVPAANADDHDDDFLLALKHNGIVATGDPAALVDWAHWTCDQLDQGAKKEYIVAWLGQIPPPTAAVSALSKAPSFARPPCTTARRTNRRPVGSRVGFP